MPVDHCPSLMRDLSGARSVRRCLSQSPCQPDRRLDSFRRPQCLDPGLLSRLQTPHIADVLALELESRAASPRELQGAAGAALTCRVVGCSLERGPQPREGARDRREGPSDSQDVPPNRCPLPGQARLHPPTSGANQLPAHPSAGRTTKSHVRRFGRLTDAGLSR